MKKHRSMYLSGHLQHWNLFTYFVYGWRIRTNSSSAILDSTVQANAAAVLAAWRFRSADSWSQATFSDSWARLFSVDSSSSISGFDSYFAQQSLAAVCGELASFPCVSCWVSLDPDTVCMSSHLHHSGVIYLRLQSSCSGRNYRGFSRYHCNSTHLSFVVLSSHSHLSLSTDFTILSLTVLTGKHSVHPYSYCLIYLSTRLPVAVHPTVVSTTATACMSQPGYAVVTHLSSVG